MNAGVPRDPQTGEDILAWAREITQFLRAHTPRPSVDILPQAGTTGTRSVLRPRASPTGLWLPPPFFCCPADPDSDHSGETGWVQVLGTGTLLASADPTDNVTIHGMDAAFQLAIEEDAEQYIWIEVDLSGDTPSGVIDEGTNWNGDDGNFFPSPVEFDTDDGTPTGTSPPPPTDRKQNTLYVPLARTYDITDNPFAPLDPPGYMLTDTVKLVQLCNTHLRLYDDCYKGDDVQLAMPWHGAIPG